MLRDHRSHATGATQPRGHDGQVKQGEQEVLHPRDRVGQTSGATQRCLILESARALGIRDAQAIETCRAQIHLAAALEGELSRLAKLGEIEVSVLTLARRAAEVCAIQPFQDRHGRWHGGRTKIHCRLLSVGRPPAPSIARPRPSTAGRRFLGPDQWTMRVGGQVGTPWVYIGSGAWTVKMEIPV